jgi:hypothetical protein
MRKFKFSNQRADSIEVLIEPEGSAIQLEPGSEITVEFIGAVSDVEVQIRDDPSPHLALWTDQQIGRILLNNREYRI